MKSNAIAALDGHFEMWKAARFPGGGGKLDLHEYYCIEQFTRAHSMTDTELRSGMVGGSQDGGIDAFYILANGELVTTETEIDLKSPPSFRVLIMQIKSDEGFSPVALDKLNWFLADLLELSKTREDYHTGYRAELIRLMRLFKDKYGLVVGDKPELTIECIYVIKKQVAPGDDCRRSQKALERTVRVCFEHAELKLHFINAVGLWKQVDSRPPLEKTITWATQPMQTPEGFIGLVKLTDFYAFIIDPDKTVAERFFDSNVRGYWPNKEVNKNIAKTLDQPEKNPEFWLLNNGVTILASKVTAGNYLENKVFDPQIVNGLQSSRQIYTHFQSKPPKSSDNRRILVRVITATEDARDEIVKCTNSQNPMPAEALRATDQIHRQIEVLFKNDGLYYDRRKGYHRDKRRPPSRIVDVIEVLQAMLSIVLQRPDAARARPRDYIKENELYKSIFGENAHSLTLYLRVTQIYRRVETYLEDRGVESIHRRNIIFYLCMYSTCKAIASPNSIPAKIQALDQSVLSDDFLGECYERIRKAYDKLAEKQASGGGERDYDALAKGPHLLRAIRTSLNRAMPRQRKKSK